MRLFKKWAFYGGTLVPRGTYFSPHKLEFYITKKKDERLPGNTSDLFYKIPLLVVPLLLPFFAVLFMLFVPGLAIFGFGFFLPKLIKRNKKVFLVSLSLPFLTSEVFAETKQNIQDKNQECLECHAKTGIHVKLKDGEKLRIKTHAEHYYRTDVHANKISCVDCHANYTKDWHPQITIYKDIKEYRLNRYELCIDCHKDQYAQLRDSIHFELLSQGNQNPPVCTDCHTVHSITSPKLSRRQVVETCRQCHKNIYDTYRQSIHGRALVEFNNRDVPTCTDCHAAHKVVDPHLVLQHVSSPEICGQCHANSKLMSKYGLRADVYRTYLDDFHGVSTKFYKTTEKFGNFQKIEAVCVDCHGIHNIQSVKSKQGVIDQSYVNQMCSRCHEKIPSDFSQAWLSHYRPSLQKYPLVFLTGLFYKIFIPFTIVGLLIHMISHFQRHFRTSKEKQ